MTKLLLALGATTLTLAGAQAQVYQSGGVYYPGQTMNGVVQTGSAVYGTPTIPGQTIVNGGVVTQQPFSVPLTTYAPQMTTYSQPMTGTYVQPAVTGYANGMTSYPANNYTTAGYTPYAAGGATQYYGNAVGYPVQNSYGQSYATPVYGNTMSSYPAAPTQGGFFGGNGSGLVGTTTNFAGQVVRVPFTVVRRVGGIFR